MFDSEINNIVYRVKKGISKGGVKEDLIKKEMLNFNGMEEIEEIIFEEVEKRLKGD